MATAVEGQEKSSLYPGEKKRPFRGSQRPLRPLLLLAGLAVVHCLNLFMQWTLISRELARKPSFHSPEYTFLGFSSLHRKELAAIARLPNSAPAGRVFAYFDFLHPAVFLAWNNAGAGEFFDLGPVLVALPAGASRIAFLPGSVFLLAQGGRSAVRSFGGSIGGDIRARALNRDGAGGSDLSASFVVKAAERSPSLRVPYLVYFFLPLVLIVIAVATSGAGMAAAFFYYAGMFFLFDFEKLFVTVPLARLFDVLGVELPAPWIKVLAVCMALSFLAAAVYGLLRWKSREMPPSGKWIVCFFILLPLALFF
jgi:hypothetical protein